MSGKSIKFGDKEINKSNFYKNKKLFKTEDIDISKILVSKNEPYSKNGSVRYIIEYNDDDVIRPLCIRLPQKIGYVNYFDNVRKMSLDVSDNKLLKNYKKIWEKVSSLMKIEFDSEPVYGDKYKHKNKVIER